MKVESSSDTYRALATHGAAELKIKGSRFLAEAHPVETAEAAETAIDAIRRREYAATHHCTAYRVGQGGDVFRFNDDGEPAGTAGPPILRQIDGRDLTQTLVVVTRYYGGTKLGTGGLIRAYGDAAAAALENGTVAEHIIRVPVRVRFRYDDTSPAMHTINSFDAEIAASHYSEETELVLALRRSQVDAFLSAFTNNLSGRGEAGRVEPSGAGA